MAEGNTMRFDIEVAVKGFQQAQKEFDRLSSKYDDLIKKVSSNRVGIDFGSTFNFDDAKKKIDSASASIVNDLVSMRTKINAELQGAFNFKLKGTSQQFDSQIREIITSIRTSISNAIAQGQHGSDTASFSFGGNLYSGTVSELKDMQTKLSQLTLGYSKALGEFGNVEELRQSVVEINNMQTAMNDAQNAMNQYMAEAGELSGLQERMSQSAQDAYIAISELNNATAQSHVSSSLENAWFAIDQAKSGMTGGVAEGLKKAYMEIGEASGTFAREEEAHAARQRESFNSVVEAAKKLGSIGKKIFSTLGSLAKKAFSGISTAVKNFGNHIKESTTRLFHFRSSFNPIEKAVNSFRGVLKRVFLTGMIRKWVNGAREAFKILAAQSNETNEAMSQMGSAVKTLGGSLASAFAPVISAVAPILTKLINIIVDAVNAVSMFFAKLSGASTYKKAVVSGYQFADAMDAAASGASGAAKAADDYKKAVMGFDQLNKIDDPNSGSSGGGGGGSGSGSGNPLSFVDAPIESDVADFADRFKKFIDDADFEGLGEYLASKVNTGLEKLYGIVSWDNIGPKVTPFITNFVTTFNSFVDNLDMDRAGRVVGAGVNTIVNTLNLLFTGIDWVNLGRKFAEGINGLVSETDFENLGGVIANGINVVWGLFKGFAEDLNWGEVGQAISDGIFGFFDKINLDEKASTLATFLNGIGEALQRLADDKETWQKVADEIVNGIQSFITTFNWSDNASALNDFIMNMVNTLVDISERVDWKDLGRSIGDALGRIQWGDILKGMATAMINALGGLLEGMSETPAGKFAIAFGAALAAIKIISPIAKAFSSSLVKSIADNMVSGETTSGLSSMAATFTGKIKTLITTHPYLLAIGAIIAATIAGSVAIINEYKEYQKSLEEGITAGQQSVAKAIKDLKDSQADFNREMVTSSDTMSANSSVASILAERIAELQSKTSLTTAEETELKTKIDQLNKIYPEMSQYVDETTGKYKLSSQAIKDLVEDMGAKAKAMVLEELFTEAIKRQTEAQLSEAKAVEEAKRIAEINMAITNKDIDTLKKHSGYLEENGINYKDLTTATIRGRESKEKWTAIVESEQKQLENCSQAYDDATSDVDRLTGEIEEFTKATKENGEQSETQATIISSSTGNIIDSYDSLERELQGLAKENGLTKDQTDALYKKVAEWKDDEVPIGQAWDALGVAVEGYKDSNQAALDAAQQRIDDFKSAVQRGTSEISGSFFNMTTQEKEAGKTYADKLEEMYLKTMEWQAQLKIFMTKGFDDAFVQTVIEAGVDGLDALKEYNGYTQEEVADTNRKLHAMSAEATQAIIDEHLKRTQGVKNAAKDMGAGAEQEYKAEVDKMDDDTRTAVKAASGEISKEAPTAKTNATNAAKGVVGAWTWNLSPLAPSMQSQMTSAINYVKSNQPELVRQSQSAGKGAADAYKTEVGKVGANTNTAMQDASNKVNTEGANLKSRFITAAKNSVSAFSENLQQMVINVGNRMEDVIDKIKGVEYSMTSAAKTIGSKISSGIEEGLKGGFTKIDSALTTIKKKFDFSISGTKVGSNFANDVAKGINGGSTYATSSSPVNTAITSLKKQFDFTISGGYSIGYNFANDIRKGVNAVGTLTIPSYVKVPHISVGYNSTWLGTGNGYASIPYFNVSYWAKGGFPDIGELFFAREDGPEMVGRMGSSTAVANNDQIVTGIANGVRSAMFDVLSSGMFNQRNDGEAGDIVIYVDSEELARASLKGQRTISRRENATLAFVGG